MGSVMSIEMEFVTGYLGSEDLSQHIGDLK